jgi:hypothetical protein
MIEITLFLYEDEFKPASDGNFHRREFVQGTKWYLSNFFKILHEPVSSHSLSILNLINKNLSVNLQHGNHIFFLFFRFLF